MFLIEYDCGSFVNAEEIQWVDVKSGVARFTLKGNTADAFTVRPAYCSTFFNHLQCINDNLTNVEKRWHELKNKPDDDGEQ